MSDNNNVDINTTDDANENTDTKKPMSLLYRILIPTIVVIYLILINNFFDNYKNELSWGIADKIKNKSSKSLFGRNKTWEFINSELLIKLNPFTYMTTQIEYIEDSVLLNSNVESVSSFLKKTGIYLLKPIILLLPIIFNTYTYAFRSVVDNEPRFWGKSWTVMILILLFSFIIPLYPSLTSFYFIGFILLFYILFPLINITNSLRAFIDAKYVFLMLGYYILSAIVTNQIKIDHPELWDNGLKNKFSVANTLLAICIIIIFFIF
jgi:hypothetical protein